MVSTTTWFRQSEKLLQSEGRIVVTVSCYHKMFLRQYSITMVHMIQQTSKISVLIFLLLHFIFISILYSNELGDHCDSVNSYLAFCVLTCLSLNDTD